MIQPLMSTLVLEDLMVEAEPDEKKQGGREMKPKDLPRLDTM